MHSVLDQENKFAQNHGPMEYTKNNNNGGKSYFYLRLILAAEIVLRTNYQYMFQQDNILAAYQAEDR